ncbi:MAG: hypothetical protein ABL977_04155 [Candidatus Eisenbacteria bacterium]
MRSVHALPRGSSARPAINTIGSTKNHAMLPSPPRRRRTQSKSTAEAAANSANGSVSVTNGASVASRSTRRSSPSSCCWMSAATITMSACEPNNARFPSVRAHR